MKKLIITMSLVALITLSVGTITFATVYWEQTDFTRPYNYHIDNAFHMYYGAKEYDDNHCWASTEVAAADDMSAYAFTRIVGIDNSSHNENSYEVKNGYVKTSAGFLNVSYAKRVKHYGYRIFSSIRQDWEYEIR